MFIMQNVWLSCLAAVLDQTQLILEQNISRLRYQDHATQ